MDIADIFLREGTKVVFEGGKPLMLDEPGVVWMVGPVKVSVFITALSEDNQPGDKRFLFDVQQGELMFGQPPEEAPEKTVLLAAGALGASLFRLEAKRLEELLDGQGSREASRLTARWLNKLHSAGNEEADIEGRPLTKLPDMKPSPPATPSCRRITWPFAPSAVCGGNRSRRKSPACRKRETTTSGS